MLQCQETIGVARSISGEEATRNQTLAERLLPDCAAGRRMDTLTEEELRSIATSRNRPAG